jgi:hypothetical protein
VAGRLKSQGTQTIVYHLPLGIQSVGSMVTGAPVGLQLQVPLLIQLRGPQMVGVEEVPVGVLVRSIALQ